MNENYLKHLSTEERRLEALMFTEHIPGNLESAYTLLWIEKSSDELVFAYNAHGQCTWPHSVCIYIEGREISMVNLMRLLPKGHCSLISKSTGLLSLCFGFCPSSSLDLEKLVTIFSLSTII